MADQYVRMPNGEYVAFPEGTSPAELQRGIRGYLEGVNAQRGTGERIARGVGMVGQGFNEGLAQTVGALPDLVASGMRAVGIPTSAPGQYTNWARQGINALVGEPQTPETTTERALQGAGRGIADAASIAIPATAVAQGARAGTLAQGVGQALAAAPGSQIAAGAVGGAVGDATDSPLLGTAAAIATPVLGALARRAITPLPISAERQALAANMAQEGIPLSAAQTSGNSVLRYAEGAMGDLPTTSGRQAAINDRSQRAFNRAALSRAGIQGDSAMPDVLAANRARLGQEFERLSAATTVQFDAPFVRAINDAQRRYGNKLPTNQRPIFQSLVDDIFRDPNTRQPRGTMPGAEYQQARSDIDRLVQANSGPNGDAGLAGALRKLRNALDDVTGRSVPPDLRRDWHQTRRQWANQRTLEGSIASGERVAEGNLSPLAMRNAVNRRDPNAYALGRGDLAGLARGGQAFMRAPPQSGTAPRAIAMNALSGGALIGAAGAGMDPSTMLAAATVPRAVQEIYNAPWIQRYLQNQVMNNPQGPVQNFVANAIPGGGGQNLLASIAAQQGLANTRAAITGR